MTDLVLTATVHSVVQWVYAKKWTGNVPEAMQRCTVSLILIKCHNQSR